jgi:hypothetical protein
VYTITINLPNTPQGQEVQIPGLGTYKNGSTNTVTKEEADAFRAYQAANNMPDDTLLQAFSKDDYVTVETAKEEKPKTGSGSDNKKDGDK